MLTLRRLNRKSLLIAAAFSALLVAGCGSGTGSVSGQVTIDGAALPSGTITFHSEVGEKRVRSSEITDGKYTVNDLQPGPAKVTVTTTPPSTGGRPPGGGKPIEVPGGTPAAGKYVPVNKKFATPAESGLSHEVKSGSQEKSFTVTR